MDYAVIGALIVIGWVGGVITGRVVASLLALIIFANTGASPVEWGIYYLVSLLIAHFIGTWFTTIKRVARD
jgi:hypothetical protein